MYTYNTNITHNFINILALFLINQKLRTQKFLIIQTYINRILKIG